ncbi:histone-lysine N-methyltransferase SETMAR [Trichonephila inaurata madagascariensis]|uniref:Histone-lysine N-methyltransferase SETMAR n=1 Tax=Trichonephila inaurata madagascariensis TaxID=2747483 RepID=A0A8X6WP48_9ARAC|nr:histone-lysine N-methyltransferase SETMAR [Trichonephila inaurata madagascariensis]
MLLKPFYRKEEFITSPSGDSSLWDRARNGRPQALDDEALQVVIEEDSSQRSGELARQFSTSSETVGLHLHRLGKTYRLSNWVPHTLLEVHKQQRVAACLSLLSRHHSPSIFNRMLTSGEKWVLHDTPKRSKHWLSPQGTVPHSARLPMHPRKIMLCVWWTCRQVVHYDQWAKRSLQTCILSNWNVYNSHCIRRSQHWLLLLHDNITTSSIPWTIIFVVNPSPMKQTYAKALTDFFASYTPEFYRKGIEQLETHWQQMLDADGDYFED